MNSSSSQYYLVIRPLSEDPSLVEPHLEALSAAIGLDHRTLRQRLMGTALRVLKVHHDQATLEELSQKLGDVGLIPSAVIGKNELGCLKKPMRSSSLEIGQKSIIFLSPSSEALFSLDGSLRCLLVLATMNVKRLQGKRLARLAMNTGSPFPLSETLSYIFRNSPIMDIYIDGSDTPIRIDSMKFNYNCMGEANTGAAACNFPAIMKKIGSVCPSVILDTGFGETELPFLDLSGNIAKEAIVYEFSLYSGFVFLAYQKGLFPAPNGKGSIKGAMSDAPIKIPSSQSTFINWDSGDYSIIENMNGMIWAGPLLLPAKNHNQKVQDCSDSPTGQKQGTGTLPPPPEGIAISRSMPGFAFLSGLKDFMGGDSRWIKTLGPPFFLYPLVLLVVISLYLTHATKSPEPLSLGVLSLGLILFIHSFVLLQRKKTIENSPTSKIRSMPMGQVEIKGYARQKYFLKSPYTFTDCVYYSYKIYDKVWRNGEKRRELKECGHSGTIPFYLEDETGRALILPDKAIIHAGITQSMLGDPLVKIFGASPSCNGEEREIVETVVPVGQLLYVIGFAHRLKISSQEKKKRLMEKLRVLKTDQDRMKEYDLDHDGKISQEEWDLARKKVEEDVLLEDLNKGTHDMVAIGEHSSGGLFYVSDKQEEWILKSMSWRIPLFLILGIACISGGAIYLLKFARNFHLIYRLFRL